MFVGIINKKIHEIAEKNSKNLTKKSRTSSVFVPHGACGTHTDRRVDAA